MLILHERSEPRSVSDLEDWKKKEATIHAIIGEGGEIKKVSQLFHNFRACALTPQTLQKRAHKNNRRDHRT